MMQSPYAAMLPQQQPQNPHQIEPYTFTQGEGDRFPRTQNMGQMQGAEQAMRQLDRAKIEADKQKNDASYASKMASYQKSQMQNLMEALRGG